MTPLEKKKYLKELFFFLTTDDLEYLISTGDDINNLITRVLDNNYKPLILDIKDLASNTYTKINYKKDLSYPEVYNTTTLNDNFDMIDDYRLRASMLHNEANELLSKGRKNKLFSVEYGSEADKKREEANEYDRKAAILIMKKSIKDRNLNKEYQSSKHKSCLIDLHRLYVKEALLFINDLYLMWNFKEINFVTGQKQKNKTLRPAVEQWFKQHDFNYYDLGAIIKGKKK